jgi:hypothetical protein
MGNGRRRWSSWSACVWTRMRPRRTDPITDERQGAAPFSVLVCFSNQHLPGSTQFQADFSRALIYLSAYPIRDAPLTLEAPQ